VLSGKEGSDAAAGGPSPGREIGMQGDVRGGGMAEVVEYVVGRRGEDKKGSCAWGGCGAEESEGESWDRRDLSEEGKGGEAWSGVRRGW
jgi:hypothetical protein